MTLPQLNVAWPAQPTSAVRLGFNVNPVQGQFELVAKAGGTLARFSTGWAGLEDWTTGALAFKAKTVEALEECSKLGLTPILTVLYSPPFKKVGEYTLAKEAKTGQKQIELTAPPVAVELFKDCVQGEKSEILSGKATGAGTLIEKVEGNTIFLTTNLTKAVAGGKKVKHQRYRTEVIKTAAKTDVGAIAFMRAARFVAEEALKYVPAVYVALQNEYTWPKDFWSNGFKCWDSAPGGWESNTHMNAILKRAMQDEAALPAGAVYINGGSDTGGSGLLQLPAPKVSAAQSAGWFDGTHPYGENPEQVSVNTAGEPINGSYDEVVAMPHMFRVQKEERANGYTVGSMATECGTLKPSYSEQQQARYDLRRTLSLMGMGIWPVVYDLETALGPIEEEPEGGVPGEEEELTIPVKEAYHCLRDLFNRVIPSLGAAGVSGDCPTSSLPEGQEWKFWSLSVAGQKKSLHVVCQRTALLLKSDPRTWGEIPSPETVNVPYQTNGEMTRVVTVYNMRTGGPVAFTSTTIPVADDPIGIVVERETDVARVQLKDVLLRNGAPVGNAKVAITVVAGAAGEAVFYTSEAGSTTKPEVVTDENGFFECWLTEGRYEIQPGKSEAKVFEAINQSQVGSGSVANEGITEIKLAKEAVSTEKVKKEAITKEKLAPSLVTEVEEKGTVGAEAITTEKLKNEAVTEAKLAANAVVEAKIKAKAVSKAKLATALAEEIEKAAVALLEANEKTAEYTLVLTDKEKMVVANKAATEIKVNIPKNSEVAFPVGTTIELVQWGTGTLKVEPKAAVTVHSSTGNFKARAQYSTLTLWKQATDTWLLGGDVE